jgi:phosphatidylglycerophosphatase A
MTQRRSFAVWLAMGFGSGLSPIVPGTVGTLPAWLLALAIGSVAPPSVWAMSAAALAACLVGFWAATAAEAVLGHDPKAVVIDEWAGILIALIGVPVTLGAYLFAFVAFRIFDVLKPPPAAQVESLPGGYGVVMDDVFAGLYALVAYHLVHALFPSFI